MKNKLGFSLTELSISLAIIGFVAGIIIAGSNLYNQSKLRAIIKELQMLNNAVNIFRDRYGYLPGDLPSPPGNWSAVAGNGNGSYDTVSEISNVWHHLFSAGLINQSFPSYSSGTNYNLYKSTYAPALYDMRSNQIFLSPSQIFLEYGFINPSITYISSYPALKPKDAYYIDIKMDDGVANYGSLMGADADSASSGSCSAIFSSSTQSIINYNLSNKTPACRFFYFGNPFFSVVK